MSFGAALGQVAKGLGGVVKTKAAGAAERVPSQVANRAGVPGRRLPARTPVLPTQRSKGTSRPTINNAPRIPQQRGVGVPRERRNDVAVQNEASTYGKLGENGLGTSQVGNSNPNVAFREAPLSLSSSTNTSFARSTGWRSSHLGGTNELTGVKGPTVGAAQTRQSVVNWGDSGPQGAPFAQSGG